MSDFETDVKLNRCKVMISECRLYPMSYFKMSWNNILQYAVLL